MILSKISFIEYTDSSRHLFLAAYIKENNNMSPGMAMVCI
ncbi:hypothetical protein HMPREF0880_02528 [Yokenella regensburgei ATCC 43003]|nr:hypothetical protein HMPREF0880_02528 [Yokenella regensburgei ATCC 43003]